MAGMSFGTVLETKPSNSKFHENAACPAYNFNFNCKVKQIAMKNGLKRSY
jgi:hypothetical protein